MSSPEPTKICPYSLSDLKNTTDDAIAPFLKSKQFVQSHKLTDVRLGLSSAACIIAALTFYLDWTKGFENTKTFTMFACIAYFTLNTALTVWMYFVESSTIYVGTHATNGTKLTITSKVEKHDPTYFISIMQEELIDNKTVVRVRDVKSSFTNWIDEKGFFVKKPFETWFADSVPYLLERGSAPELTGGMVTASGRDVRETFGGVEVGSGSLRGKRGKKT